MRNLVLNEWVKIFRQKGTWAMLGLLFVVIIGFAGISKYVETIMVEPSANWKTELENVNRSLEENLKGAGYAAPSLKEHTERTIAINEYRIKHDLAPKTEYSGWSFLQDSSTLISFAGLLVIIVAAGIVANEFSWGTIKVLLTKPYRRWKVLLAKYITVNLFLALVLVILFASSLALGFILFGTGEEASRIHLAFVNGEVVEQSQLLYLMKVYIFSSLSAFMLTAMAFMISAVFRNSGLAIGISIFLLLMGDTVTNLLAGKFDWAKYSLFANTNLIQYFDGMPLVEGMTMTFSIVMLLLYFAIFQTMAFLVFSKRDIAG